MSFLSFVQTNSWNMVKLAIRNPTFHNLQEVDAEHNNALHILALKGHHSNIRDLISRGLDINARNQTGKTPLHHAIQQNNLETAQELLRHGADVNQPDKAGWTSLFFATLAGNIKCVRMLFNKGADINRRDKRGENAMHVAARHNHKGLIVFYMTKQIDINCANVCKQTPLAVAIHAANSDIAIVLIGYNASTRADMLHDAVGHGDYKLVKLLLKSLPANVLDGEVRTALHIAAEGNRHEIAQLLLRNGADVNAQDIDGYSPFLVAVQKGHQEVLKVMLATLDETSSHSSVLNVRITSNHGDNALHLLAASDLVGDIKMEIFDILLPELHQLGKSTDELVNKTNRDFRTPLHFANEHLCKALKMAMINLGADVDEIDKFGRKPAQYCSVRSIEKGNLNRKHQKQVKSV